jgi:hypothetical protein
MKNSFRRDRVNQSVLMTTLLLILFSNISMTSMSQVSGNRRNSTSTDFSYFERKFPWIIPTDTTVRNNAYINYLEANVKEYKLPDILTLNNGEKVTNTKVWEKQRRGELLDLFRSEIYGVAPPKPENLIFRVIESNPMAMKGLATYKLIEFGFKLKQESFRFHSALIVPNKRTGPAPAFLLVGRNLPIPIVLDSTLNIPTGLNAAPYLISRGYALTTLNVKEEIDPDSVSAKLGIRNFYRRNYNKPEELTWGAIGAWAWSAMRVMDYLETDPDINKSQIGIIGHSRWGKTSLWAGAQDTRFAMVAPSGSGSTGTKLSKRNFGEDIKNINKFKHWFTTKYKTYDDKEALLPIDQHELVALVAPPAYHDSQGSADLWADPRGAWLSLVEASKVWVLYGKAKEMNNRNPQVNELVINGPVVYHMHDGGHALMLFDWKMVLDQADLLWRSKGIHQCNSGCFQ